MPGSPLWSDRRHKRWLRRLIALSLIFFLGWYGKVASDQIRLAFAFRKHPNSEDFRLFMSGDTPHEIVARYIIFYGGTEGYRADLRAWVGWAAPGLSNSIWNRFLLERDLRRLTAEDRSEYLLHYPLTLSTGVLPLVKADIESGEFAGLAVLRRIKGGAGLETLQEWVSERLLKTNDKQLFVQVHRYLAICQCKMEVDLLRRYWPLTDDMERQQLIDELVTAHQEGSDPDMELFAWINESIREGRFQRIRIAFLVATYLKHDSTRSPATDYVLNEAAHLSREDIRQLLSEIGLSNQNLKGEQQPVDAMKLAGAVISKYEESDPEIAVSAFEYVAQNQDEVDGFEKFVDSVLSEPDSEFRKGVIVILVRQGITSGQEHVDEAFSGQAPRRTMFEETATYFEGSKAGVRYKQLAGHDYLETGKQWPPASPKSPLRLQDGPLWRQFIDDYPWFPATDDAYYHLAYRQFATGDLRGALESVDEYLTREHPDRDAEPYVLLVARSIALQTSALDGEFPVLRQIRFMTAHPLATLAFDQDPQLDQDFQAALDWFDAHPQQKKWLGAPEPTLVAIRAAYLRMKSAPLEQRVRVLSEFANASDVTLYELLYGRFLDIESLRDEASERAIAQSADKAGRALRGDLMTQEGTGALEWAILHHRQRFCCGDAAVKAYAQIYKFLEALSPQRVPASLRSEFVNEFGRRSVEP